MTLLVAFWAVFLIALPTQASAQAFVRPCQSSILSKYTLQGFTASECNSLSTGDTVALTDTRNKQVYRVRKFADGHCWMIDNMKLAGVTLTPADSDVTSNVTLPATITSGSSVDTTMQIIDGSTQTHCATASNFATDSITRCGYYYNWMAATAGSGTAALASADAPRSICPKGWKLPLGAAANIDGSFAKLASVAGFTNNAVGSTALKNDTTGFSTRLSGLYLSGWGSMDTYGFYWSRSAYSDATGAYYLSFGSSHVNPQDINIKSYGFSVRCVL